MINSAAKVFAGVANPSVTFVERSTTGALVSWVENGFAMSVDRLPSSSALVLRAAKGSVRAIETLVFDASGRYVRSDGDVIPTVFAHELRLGGVAGASPVTAVTDPVTGVSRFSPNADGELPNHNGFMSLITGKQLFFGFGDSITADGGRVVAADGAVDVNVYQYSWCRYAELASGGCAQWGGLFRAVWIHDYAVAS